VWYKHCIEQTPDINVALHLYLRAETTSQAWKTRVLNGDREDELTLIANLDHERAQFRGISAQALGMMHSQQAVPLLIEKLHTDPDDHVRFTCAQALKNFPTPEVIHALIQAIDDPDSNTMIRNAIVDVLGELKAMEAKPKILEYKNTSPYQAAQDAADDALKHVE
jgi:HEAT repeat protein